MSPALDRSTVIKCFERGNAVKIRNGIMFDFYPELPHTYMYMFMKMVKKVSIVCACNIVLFLSTISVPHAHLHTYTCAQTRAYTSAHMNM